MYVITGATGNTGSVVAEKLLAGGQKVRVIGRDAKRLERFTSKGAEPFTADVTDASAMTAAFAGATAAYVMIPPNSTTSDFRRYQGQVSDAMVAAIEKNHVPHVVALSSVGADKPGKTGPVTGLHDLEEKLNRVNGLNAVYLRAGYFMENILPQVDVIQHFGSMAGPVRSDLQLPMIATRDIGAAAAEALLRGNFEGKRPRELQGARDVSYGQVARIVGDAIGKPGLAYKQLSADQMKPALTQMGMSPDFADLLLEMSGALNSGYMAMLEPRTSANSTPTTIETFVQEVFVPAYGGKAARV
jgi:uncharacterized protein YbjT (DUF2867 family)